MKKIFLMINVLMAALILVPAQEATIREEKIPMTTYMFSEPDPVPDISRIYPYFRFDGYTNKGIQKEWNMVILENDYIRVYVCPDIGGKVWGAIEKSTGGEFLYFNHVVKFRDVAMRGAWTSGGLEFNFGDIGHIPTCATPVDYVTRNNPDGSVSCIVGAIDLPSSTRWNVEVIVYRDKAFFETKVSWFNGTELPCTYYHWMNAAAKSSGNLEFFYPGNMRIGHGGEVGEWPVENGRELSLYDKNNFGSYKSYHVINAWSDYFGGYWRDDDFGFGHYSKYDERPGKKLWIWGLSQQGMIWEDLLTDEDGQYIEFQSGKLFNQAANSSTFTPYKHREFYPHDGDMMNDLWFPLKKTGGMVAASEYAVLNVTRKDNQAEVILSALQILDEELHIRTGDIEINSKVGLRPLELFKTQFTVDPQENFTIVLGDDKLIYSSDEKDLIIDRPVEPNPQFDWNSPYGIYTQALEMEKQRQYTDALNTYLKVLDKEPAFLPALGRVALAYYRIMDYERSLDYARRSLMVDTYDPLANYVFGLVNRQTGNLSQAKSGFAVASQSVEYRTAAYTELAVIFLNENNLTVAEQYASKALNFNRYNTTAREILAIISRRENNREEAMERLAELAHLDPLNHFVNYEYVEWGTLDGASFQKNITNELPFESFLDLAMRYLDLGCTAEVISILKMAPQHAEVLLWLAYLDTDNRTSWMQSALDLPADMVFPYREPTLKMLEFFIQQNDHWKLKYYSALIYWKMGMMSRTKELFMQCGETPDFVPFYLARLELFRGDMDVEIHSLEKALELAPSDWRVNMAWINHYLNSRDYEKAMKLSKSNLSVHPENSAFGFRYARALMELKEYKKCISFLEKFEVLPNEGAMTGRNTYHEACIRAAFDALKKKKYEDAIGYAQKAKLWPVNLGVGKPYDTDERLDNMVIAYASEMSGLKEQADKFYSEVMNHNVPDYLDENSKLILQALILRKKNREDKAMELIQTAVDRYPDNDHMMWVQASFTNDAEAPVIENKILNSAVQVFDYDTRFSDDEFRLVIDFLDIYQSK